MEQVPLGASDLMVSRLGFGCMSLSYVPHDDKSAGHVLWHALDLGVTFFDTAGRYGRGHNERLVGRAFSGSTDEIVLATKFGFVGDPADRRAVDGRPNHVRAACDASLRRLGVEVIDLYYLHRVDAGIPVEETVGAMAELIDVGKVRALGLSEAAPATIRRAHAIHPISAVQSRLSLWSREAENGPLQVCRELGITFVASSPLAQHNIMLVDTLRDLADDLGCTPAQLALSWLFAKGSHVVPIPGTRRVDHVEENVVAVHIGLGARHIQELETAFAPDAPAGHAAPIWSYGPTLR